MENNLLSVAEVSDLLSLSPDTVRRWEKKGLIRSHRSELNYRLFDFNEVNLVKQKYCENASKGFHVLSSGKKTKYKVIDLFSGAGGTALGLENAGLQHDMLVEYDRHAAATLSKNRPDWNVIAKDVREVDFSGMRTDIVEGGFPCQTFSYAGRRKGFEDTRGTLFFDFARCIKETRPKIAIGENVRGLLKHEDGKTLEVMIGALREIGYRVAYKVLRAQYHDVPQKRERLIIIALRHDMGKKAYFPKENNYIVTLRDALLHCPVSDGQSYTARKEKIMKLIPEGGYWRDLPNSLQKQYMGASYFLGGGKTGMARRLAWSEPSLTLTCNPAQKQTERCHPSETRPLTVREYARIQTFPDNWEFSGSVAAQYKQIGNAVPVNLGYHVGRCVVGMLEKKFDSETMDVQDAS